MEVMDCPPQTGSNHVLSVVWSGNPTKNVVRPYIGWMNSVNKLLSDEWNVKLMHVFLIAHDRLETWSYEPGKPPQKIDVP